jgi:uncharacterized protein
MNRLGATQALLLWLAISWMPAAAQEIAIPFLSGRVVDHAAVLSTEARERLAGVLAEHERKTGNQVVVLTLPSLAGEGVEEFAVRVFEDWALGSRDKDNGVLVLVVPQDRRMRIEVGYGLEDTLTDAAASRIIRDLMAPRFREGNYDVGIEAGLTAILQVLEGRQVADTGWVEPEFQSSGMRFPGAEMALTEKILIGAFVFGIIGLFTFIGLVMPGGMGWFLYFFLIPFWSMFPMALFGSDAALRILGAYALLYPLVKILLARQPWYRKAHNDLKTKGFAEVGGMTLRTGGGGGIGGFSSGGGFSGGGGRSGGGGASGSW